MNALYWPAGRNRPITQRILALGALAVLGDLAQRRLSDIEIRVALEMVRGDRAQAWTGSIAIATRMPAMRRVMLLVAGDGPCRAERANRWSWRVASASGCEGAWVCSRVAIGDRTPARALSRARNTGRAMEG